MTRILQSSWFVSLTGCLLYWGTTAALIKPAQFAGFHHQQEEAQVSPENAPSWKFRNPEFDQWINEIKHEKENLATREQQLQELQARLETERQELTTVTQTIQQLQADFDHNVVRFKDQEGDNVKRQVKLMASMTPEGATAMLDQMPDDDVVKLLVVMKVDQASQLLDSMSKKGSDQARRAATILERMRNVLPPQAAGRGAPST